MFYFTFTSFFFPHKTKFQNHSLVKCLVKFWQKEFWKKDLFFDEKVFFGFSLNFLGQILNARHSQQKSLQQLWKKTSFRTWVAQQKKREREREREIGESESERERERRVRECVLERERAREQSESVCVKERERERGGKWEKSKINAAKSRIHTLTHTHTQAYANSRHWKNENIIWQSVFVRGRKKKD